MMYKLLVSDIDGTLIPFLTHKISDENKKALIDLQERGYKIALASGRVRQGMEEFAQELRMDEFGGFIICNNGAEIINCQTKEILYTNHLASDAVALLYQEAQDHNINAMLMQEEFIIMSGYDEAVDVDHQSVNTDFIWPYDMTPYLMKPTYRMNFTRTSEALDEFEVYMRKKYGDQYAFIRPQRIFLDVMSKGVDKATAVKALVKHLGISMEEVVACGDGGNDLLMVKEAGMGIAVMDGFETVKQVANEIAPKSEDHAIAWVIEKFFK